MQYARCSLDIGNVQRLKEQRKSALILQREDGWIHPRNILYLSSREIEKRKGEKLVTVYLL